MLSSHQKRLCTALILLPILALIIWQKGFWITSGLIIISLLGLFEFYNIFWQEKKYLILKSTGILLGIGIILIPIEIFRHFAPLVTLILFWLCALIFLTDFGLKEKYSFSDALILLASFYYLPLNLKIFQDLTSFEIILVLISAFASDTLAYYAGCLWGDKKIWPKVSPKKTWIGSLGGLIGCTAINILAGFFWGKKTIILYILLGVCLNLAAQLGDFFESALKRKYNIKDSGNILPGHGGILDRIDSLLFILPVYFGFKFLGLF